MTKNKLTKEFKKDLFNKANLNAIAGYPISYGLNLAFLHLFPSVEHFFGGNYALATLTFGTPYYVASVVRQYGFDWVFFKYGVSLDPKFYILKLFKVLKKQSPDEKIMNRFIEWNILNENDKK